MYIDKYVCYSCVSRESKVLIIRQLQKESANAYYQNLDRKMLPNSHTVFVKKVSKIELRCNQPYTLKPCKS